MKLGTGIHPRHWHRGAWILLLVLAALALVLTHRPSGGTAFAATLSDPDPSGDAIQVPPIEEEMKGMKSEPSHPKTGYVAEIVDSSYTVGPAEFFALDLPTTAGGSHATHIFGTVTTKGKKDIIVRLFKASDYDRWLKEKSGRIPRAFWTSPRSGNLTLDQDLPTGEPVVLLLDNGYSIRTPKKVSCQLQLRYQKGTETFDTEAGTVSGAAAAPKTDEGEPDNLPAPRTNTDDEMPPPPPPPPSGN
jgi:hypothetical protein